MLQVNLNLPIEVVSSFKLSSTAIYNICVLYKNGATVTQLAKDFSVNKTTICRILQSCGVERKRRDGKFSCMKVVTNELKQNIVRGFKEKKKIKQLMLDHGLSYHVITDILKEAGLKKGIKSNKIPAPIKRLCKDWERGNVTIYDLAKIHELTADKVRYWLIKCGYGVTNMAGKPTIQHAKDIVTPGVTSGELRRLCRDATPEFFKELKEMAMDSEVDADLRVNIMFKLIERGFGKTKEASDEEDAPLSAQDRVMKSLPGGGAAKIFSIAKKTGTDDEENQ